MQPGESTKILVCLWAFCYALLSLRLASRLAGVAFSMSGIAVPTLLDGIIYGAPRSG